MSLHFVFLVVFCCAVGAILGGLLRRRPREAAKLAAWIAGGMIAAALVIAWAMHLIPT